MAEPPKDKRSVVNPDEEGQGVDQRVITVPVTADAVENGDRLKYYLNTVIGAMTPTIDNRILLLLPPGDYDLGTGSGISLSNDYVDVEGYGASRYNRESGEYTKPGTYIHLNAASPVIAITARDTHVRNLRVENESTERAIQINEANGCDKSRFVDLYLESASGAEAMATNDSGTTLIAAYLENCHTPDSLAQCTEFSGEARNCSGGDNSFGSQRGVGTATCSGHLEDCIAGDKSYGYTESAATDALFSGVAKRCIGGDKCFGYSDLGDGTFNGQVTDCVATDYSYGSTGTPATQGGIVGSSAVLSRCNSGSYSFGGSDTPAGNEQFLGIASLCNGTLNCFASDGDFAGSLFDCVAAGASFGGVSGSTSQQGKTMIRCVGLGLTVSIGLRDYLKIAHCELTAAGSLTDGVLQVTDSATEAPRVLNSTIDADSGSTYAVDSDGGANDIKMALCVLSLDIDPDLTNLIGSGNNVVDADL